MYEYDELWVRRKSNHLRDVLINEFRYLLDS